MRNAFLTCAASLVLCAFANTSQALFFSGIPTTNFGASSGTVTSTPLIVPNNPNQEIDINGPLDVTNATPPLQVAQIRIQAPLDPTFNGGTPLFTSLQITQNGFVVVPTGGNIYGWTIEADMIDNTNTPYPGAYLLANSPAPLYTAGLTNYASSTPGGAFLYNPATTQKMVVTFTSYFDGLVPPNVYTWDFPLQVTLLVPEPASLGLVASGALLLLRRRR